MVQIGVGAWAERGAPRSTVDRVPGRAARIHRPALRIRQHPRRERVGAPGTQTGRSDIGRNARRPQIRLQPIVAKPLQPYVLRESACAYLECRVAGRSCLAARRPIGLDYQVAFCLGPRHEQCAHFRGEQPIYGPFTARRLAYATAAIAVLVLLSLAALQGVGLGSTSAMGRMVGFG